MNDAFPSNSAIAPRIGFFVFPDFQLLDLSGPLAAFEVANFIAGRACYEIVVVSSAGGAVRSSAGVEVSSRAAGDAAFDTLIVVGGEGARTPDPPWLGTVRELAGRARRVASVCTGAFALAGAGLLTGRRATTHWRRAALLQQMFPDVRVEPDRIFVRDGEVWTSAGIVAGIDLALAMIEQDLGRDAARATAGQLVVDYRRPGGQSQHSQMQAMAPDCGRIQRALAYARAHLRDPLPVEALAGAAALSLRQFNRAFRAQTGETPARAVERLRIEAAKARVEAGAEPIETIAAEVGFGDPERMRRAFVRHFGHPPQSLRRLAR